MIQWPPVSQVMTGFVTNRLSPFLAPPTPRYRARSTIVCNIRHYSRSPQPPSALWETSGDHANIIRFVVFLGNDEHLIDPEGPYDKTQF